MSKTEVGPITVERALNDYLLIVFMLRSIVKSGDMIVETCFFEESLTEISFIDLLMSARLLNSTGFAKEYNATLVHEFYVN